MGAAAGKPLAFGSLHPTVCGGWERWERWDFSRSAAVMVDYQAARLGYYDVDGDVVGLGVDVVPFDELEVVADPDLGSAGAAEQPLALR